MKKNLVFSSLLMLLVLFNSVTAQFKKDTSYTVYSAYKKISKSYSDVSYPNTSELKANLGYFHNIEYLEIDQNRKLHLDIIKTKENSQNNPVIIFVHGGGWCTGSKELLFQLGEKIAFASYTSVLVEYRLAPEAKYPAAIEDIKNAYLWLNENSEKYKISKENYSFLGTSAGAQIAGFAALKLANNYDNIGAYVNIDGIVSFVTPMALQWENRSGENSMAARWFGGSYEQVPDLWNEASIIQYVNSKSPATIFVNSSYERFHAGRGLFIEKLNNYGINSKIVEIDDSPHSFWLLEPWFSETSKAIIKFLNDSFARE